MNFKHSHACMDRWTMIVVKLLSLLKIWNVDLLNQVSFNKIQSPTNSTIRTIVGRSESVKIHVTHLYSFIYHLPATHAPFSPSEQGGDKTMEGRVSLFLKYYSIEHIPLYFDLLRGRMGRVFPINFYDVCQHLLNTFITNRVFCNKTSSFCKYSMIKKLKRIQSLEF